VAVEGSELTFVSSHLRTSELEYLAAAVGAEIVYLPMGQDEEGEGGPGHRHHHEGESEEGEHGESHHHHHHHDDDHDDEPCEGEDKAD
jgi:hypothetical protein